MDKTFIFQGAGMDDDFNVDEFRPSEYRPDTELTLGPMLLLGLFFGLVLLCGLCFGVGYSMGSHGAHESPATGKQPGPGAASPAPISHPKPAATSQNTPQPPPAAATAPTSSPSAASAQPAPVLPASMIKTEAGAGTAGAQMVQIAAVSHQEDADVLVRALRKRGYAVTVSRDAADNQFHVRIGPFVSRNDANALRRKLLNDGYNAIVQP
jgi:DedD protein